MFVNGHLDVQKLPLLFLYFPSPLQTPVTSTPPAPSKYQSSETRKYSGNSHQSLEPSRSVDGSTILPGMAHNRRGKGRHTLPLKNRSRSVFIRLQLPNQRTPPLPHRNLAILGESDSDTEWVILYNMMSIIACVIIIIQLKNIKTEKIIILLYMGIAGPK